MDEQLARRRTIKLATSFLILGASALGACARVSAFDSSRESTCKDSQWTPIPISDQLEYWSVRLPADGGSGAVRRIATAEDYLQAV